VRSLFGDVGCDRLKLGWLCAIAVWGCGMRSFKIRVVVCDRCLGMLGEQSFKIGVVCDRCLGMWGAIV
jgi:hypothetical protein